MNVYITVLLLMISAAGLIGFLAGMAYGIKKTILEQIKWSQDFHETIRNLEQNDEPTHQRRPF